MLVNGKEILNWANLNKCAIPSPDFVNQDTLKTYVEVAEMVKMPIIVSFSEAHKKFMSLEEAAMLGKYYGKMANVPVCLHIDHGKSIDFIKEAIDQGFTSVMIDASLDTFSENVRKTIEIVNYAHERNVTVEAEIGHVGSGKNYENEKESDSIYTSVDDCVKFVGLTGVDSIAVSIGTAHGIYKGGTPNINFERLQEIKNHVSIPLVLHGGSSSGDENLRKCAILGISKINIFTDIVNEGYKEIQCSCISNMTEVYEAGKIGMKRALLHYYKLFCKSDSSQIFPKWKSF